MPIAHPETEHEENVIEVHDVSFSYDASEVLQNINLTIHRGDYLGLVGGNGSGKTTLIKIILGLLKPSSGTVRLLGTNIGSFKDWSKIGYVPQKATSFDSNFPATVQEVVLMGRYGRRGLFHRITQQDREKAQQALRYVEMEEYTDRLIGDLSGGQQQRVFIARALATEPEIMFLDEPTVGVEKNIKDDFYILLKKLNEQLHLTVVLVTHDIESMAHEAMHIACIDQTIFFHDSVDMYFKESHKLIHPHP
ncbi:MAG: zinc transporter ATP-binding protein [Candidatus Adlerbacteria bacterium]|nr:zinc transporter ATP-binding protein [Candidatus Adlerbacteria bacterium]